LSIDGLLVLPPDVHIGPALELSPDLREKIGASEQDFTVTRQRARATSRVVDKDSADLLQRFRTPTRIVDAVLSFAGERGVDPASTLDQSYPVLSRLYRGRFLVPADSAAARPIEGQLEPGDLIDGFRLIRCIQVLEDNEVFLGRDGSGRYAAVKFYRAPSSDVIAMLRQEADLMNRVGPGRAPRVLGLNSADSGVALVTEWILGDDARGAAELLRGRPGPCCERQLLALCTQVAAAFADVHDCGVLHGDVHPRNVLVERTGTVRLIDFGLARPIEALSDRDVRGGVPFYFDPEFAQAQREYQTVAATCAAEQYSVAALLYQMWTGVHYLDWRLEREAMLRQIVEDEPASFQARRVAPWPELEQILRRALHKDPEGRFADLRSVAESLGALLPVAEERERRAVAGYREPSRVADLADRLLKRYELGGEALRDGRLEAPRATINHGAAGIAYTLLRIAQRRQDGRLLALADLWSQKAYALASADDAFYSDAQQIDRTTVGERSLFHSAAGLHCVRALVSAAQRDGATANRAVGAFVKHSLGPNHGVERASQLDAVVGEASLLLGCSELIEAIPESPDFDLAAVRGRGDELAGEICKFIGSSTIEASEQLATLGMAHGWGGMAFALLRWARANGRAPAPSVRARLDELAALAEPHGAGLHWPVQWGGSTFLEGWCNGSAGYAMLYALTCRLFDEPGFAELAERAAISAWNSDIAVGTLCCGQAGIAYAMLAAYRVTGSEQWLLRAKSCWRRAAQDPSPHLLQDALYKGAVGLALLAEELESPEAAAMPLFEPVS
jgi:serine/threonine protein kinase